MDHKILQYNLVRPTVSPPETYKRLTPPLFKVANPIATPVSFGNHFSSILWRASERSERSQHTVVLSLTFLSIY